MYNNIKKYISLPEMAISAIIAIAILTLFNLGVSPEYISFWLLFLVPFAILSFIKEKSIKAVGILSILVFGTWILNSPVTRAESFANLLEVKDSNLSAFNTVEADVRKVTSDMAFKKANKIIGEKVNGVQLSSQYELNMDSASIQEVKGEQLWVIPLDYSGFFKWLNQDNVPGYITISATNINAEPKLKLGRKIIITENGYFGSNINRVAWWKSGFKNTESHFEIDDKGTPFWISVVERPSIGFYAATVTAVVITNAETKVSENLSIADTVKKYPWIDRIWPENIIEERVTWNGSLKDGFLNALFTQNNVNTPTSYNEQELWLVKVNGKLAWFCGMTSLNGKDQSLVNGMMVEAVNPSSKPIMHTFDVSGVTDENGAVEAIDSALGADSIKWNTVLPQPFIKDGQFFWTAVVVSQNNIFQKVGIMKGNDISKVAFGTSLDEAVKSVISKSKKSDNSTASTKDQVISEIVQKIEELNLLKEKLLKM